MNDLIERLRKRAEIRRKIRREDDRIADLLDEAADEITNLQNLLGEYLISSPHDED